jgi:hypothetical protein
MDGKTREEISKNEQIDYPDFDGGVGLGVPLIFFVDLKLVIIPK